MSVSLLTMRRCNSPTPSSARSTGSSARASGPPSPPTSHNGSATASKRPSGNSNSASRCGWARSASTSIRAVRDSSRPRSSGESSPFAHSSKSAYGVLLHKAIEVEVGARDGMDPHEVAQVAVGRVLEREDRFVEYWRALPASEQDDVLMEVVRRVTLFQASFPPLKPLRRELAPISELRVRSELLGGDLVLSGQIDLVLGLPDKLEPMRATRLAVDLKTGGAYPEFAEDMRFYALVMTLRFGVPPYRGGVAVPGERHLAVRGRHRGSPRPRGRQGDRGRTCCGRPGQRSRGPSAARHLLHVVPALDDVPGRRAPHRRRRLNRPRPRCSSTLRVPMQEDRSIGRRHSSRPQRKDRRTMGSISRGFRLAKASWGVVRQDQQLLVLPVVSFFCSLVVIAVFAAGSLRHRDTQQTASR